MRPAHLCLLALTALSGAAAQTQSGGTFQTGVTVIQVPVVVRDRDGHVVSNLEKDAFQLFDNGKRQEIVSFSVERPGSQTAPDRSLAVAQAPMAQSAGATPMSIPARYIAYVFDDLTLPDFGDLKRIRDAAARQLGALQPGDRAAIFTSSCSGDLDFTRRPFSSVKGQGGESAQTDHRGSQGLLCSVVEGRVNYACRASIHTDSHCTVQCGGTDIR